MKTEGLIAPPGFLLYPEPADVFDQDMERHLKVMHPILSVPAARIDPAWEGVLHIVLPVEPYDGALGESSDEYYGPYCGLGWIRLVRQGSHYRFLGDWRYFAIYRAPDEYDISSYAEQGQRYLERKLAWAEHRSMGGYRSAFDETELGGLPESGPWDFWLRTQEDVAEWGDKPGQLMCEKETVDGVKMCYPLNEQGQRYRLVGRLPGYCYIDFGADELVVFYDPATESILLIPGFT